MVNKLLDIFRGETQLIEIPGCPVCRRTNIGWIVGIIVPEHSSPKCPPETQVEMISTRIKVTHNALIRFSR